MSDKIVGIDLGTTNSAIAHVEDGLPSIIPNLSGNHIVPSVVSISEDNTRVVGQAAKNLEVQKPERTVSSIKREIGSDYTVNIDDESYSPEEISSYIIDKLVTGAERRLDEDINKAVITVPAYFNDRQRNATIDAGRISDIEVERIINEPTAAAMAYGISGYDDSKIMVYDLGGGTFDVSILEIGSGLYEIKSTSGINQLGGDDWTQRIVDHIQDRIIDQYGVEITDSREKQRIWEEAEKAKKELSSSKETDIIIPFITEENDRTVDVNFTLTRSDFKELTQDLLEKTKDPMEDALKESGLSYDEIDDILLVGGSTRMPQVQKLVEDLTGITPKKDINPEEVVAKGAAVQAAVLDNKEYDSDIDDVVLLDVTPISLGVEVEGGLFEPVIDKNTTIPAQGVKQFTTAKNNQTSVTINVYQGERKVVEENTFLDSFKLKGIPSMPAGHPEIEVRFTVNENGVLSVSAKERSSGRSKEIEIEGGVGMSDDEISEARKDALKHRKEDAMETEKTRLKNLAQSQINQAQSIIRSYDVPDQYEDKIEKISNELEEEINQAGFNQEYVAEKTDELEMAVEELTIKHL